MWTNLSALVMHHEVLNCQYKTKFTFVKSTGYEERFSNHYSVEIYGTFTVLDVCTLHAIPSMFFQVIAVGNGHWCLDCKQLKASHGFWIHRSVSVF